MKNRIFEKQTMLNKHFIGLIAITLGISGLLFASISIAYIAGMFGISTALASQIVTAVSVGGAALSIALAIGSGGLAAAAVSTAKWAIKKWGQKVAVA